MNYVKYIFVLYMQYYFNILDWLFIDLHSIQSSFESKI